MKRDPKYLKQGHFCIGCSFKKVNESRSEYVNQSYDTESHIAWRCPAYADLKLNLNLENQSDFLLHFIQAVFDRQTEEEGAT